MEPDASPRRPRLHEVPPYEDQVARWESLRFQFPEAGYGTDGTGFFYGALREEDTVLRRLSLGRLIDALLARG